MALLSRKLKKRVCWGRKKGWKKSDVVKKITPSRKKLASQLHQEEERVK